MKPSHNKVHSSQLFKLKFYMDLYLCIECIWLFFMILGALENVLQLKLKSRLKKVRIWNSAKHECVSRTNTNCERRTPRQLLGCCREEWEWEERGWEGVENRRESSRGVRWARPDPTAVAHHHHHHHHHPTAVPWQQGQWCYETRKYVVRTIVTK